MAKLSLGNIFLLSLLVSSVMWISSDGATSSSQFITEDTTLCRDDFMFDQDCKNDYPNRCVGKCFAKYNSKLILADCMRKYAVSHVCRCTYFCREKPSFFRNLIKGKGKGKPEHN
ncbi:hypothetical protein HN51_053504 [Arachis hypogaea]|uniref:Knottin scorpion toxin-like domain-containing protein n=1 Tax=Arachis hypogaea TaxID=3818 RepID=A0A6B9V3E3_ARAHY|nr:uncharacterized protein DS421_19g638930 [Arachis hypogaea]